MKCFILAGGMEDSLWPVSRKDCPKQFIAIKRGRSMFQETVALNMPFCEEFYIITNVKFKNIVEEQLRSFKDLNYKLILEEIPLKTAAPVAVAAALCDRDERILIVSSDRVIEGADYNECIFACKKQVESGHSAIVGMPIISPEAGYGYIETDGKFVNKMFENVGSDLASQLVASNKYLWDAGIIMSTADKLINTFRIHCPDLYRKTIDSLEYIDVSGDKIVLRKEKFSSFPVMSLAKAANYYADNVVLVRGNFYWNRLMDLRSLAEYKSGGGDNILRDCKNVSVINGTPKKLIVAAGLKDVVIADTEDALLVSASDIAGGVKDALKNWDTDRFENSSVLYESWGKTETVLREKDFKIKKVTIYAGKSAYMHVHKKHREYWSVIKGSGVAVIDGESKAIEENGCIFIPVGCAHQVINNSDEDIVIVETEAGISSHSVSGDSDLIPSDMPFVKLAPAFKDYIWGGDKLKKIYSKNCAFINVAESWEMSAHSAGESVVNETELSGYTFKKYIQSLPKDKLGWKCAEKDEFPLLIKFIDARENLSVQVHPSDSYAYAYEHESGKNEMLYIVDAEEGAKLYIGFKRNMRKEEIEDLVDEETILDYLNEIEVKKGEAYFVEAGTIFAIGKGVLAYEVGQNSNSNYRIFDYGRTDKFGNMRPLHLEKAKEVLNYGESRAEDVSGAVENICPGVTRQILSDNRYFVSVKYTVAGKYKIDIDNSSFAAITFTEGGGNVNCAGKNAGFSKGDTFFFTAGNKTVLIDGSCTFIHTII